MNTGWKELLRVLLEGDPTAPQAVPLKLPSGCAGQRLCWGQCCIRSARRLLHKGVRGVQAQRDPMCPRWEQGVCSRGLRWAWGPRWVWGPWVCLPRACPEGPVPWSPSSLCIVSQCQGPPAFPSTGLFVYWLTDGCP